jgi:hypothetical protein
MRKTNAKTVPNNIILQFAFETGDTSKKYWQEWVAVTKADDFDYAELEDSISSYMESYCGEDTDYTGIVETVMNESGLPWRFINGIFPESKAVDTYWI